MSMYCPKTHFDLIAENLPTWTDFIAKTAAANVVGRHALIREDLKADNVEFGLKAAVVDAFKLHLKQIGYPTAGITFDDAVRASSQNVNDQMQVRLHELVPLTNYLLHGKKTFFFGGNLTEKLSETDVNVSAELLKMPFPACMFVYDNQVARDALYGVYNREAPRKGTVTAYLMNFIDEDGNNVMSMDVYDTQSSGEFGVAVRRQLVMAEGNNIEDVLKTDWAKINQGKNKGGHRATDVEVLGDKVFMEEGLKIVRIIANSALYLASANPDIIPGLREAPKVDGRAPFMFEKRMFERRLTSTDYITVGSSCKPYAEALDVEGRKLDHQIKVRGHWRSQPYGPGMSLRRDTFIEPYWKGPDAAEILNKSYSVR